MTPTIGRIVLYTLTEQDANEINRRRDDRQTYQREQPREATGYIAHVGNQAAEGDTYPAVVVRTFDPSVNLHVLLDGNDTYWATSRVEGEGPGTWAWPARKGN